MSIADRFRAEVRLQLSADGLGEADRLRQELQRVQESLTATEQTMKAGVVDVGAYKREITRLTGEYNFFARALEASVAAQAAQTQAAGASISHAGAWTQAIKSGTEAARAYNQQLTDTAAIQARLGQMEERTRRDQEDTAAFQAAQDLLAVRARLAEMNRRDMQDEAEAAALRRQSTAEAVAQAQRQIEEERIMLGLIAEQTQAERDLAAVRRALGGMDARDHEVKAAEAAEQAERELLEVREALARMEERDAAAALAAGEATVRAAREGTEAVQAQAAAGVELGRAERERAAAAESLARQRAAWVASNAKEEAAAAASLATQKKVALDKIDQSVTEHLAHEGSLWDQYRRTILGVNREQEYLNDVIAQGADMEATATRVTNTFTQARGRLSTEEEHLQQTILATGRAIAGMPEVVQRTATEFEQGRSASERFSYSILHVAHAIQDAQYGFGAVLNNIPLVVQAFGGGAGLAGTVMIAGVAIDTASRHMGGFASAIGLGLDPAKNMTVTAGALKDRLDALQSKTFKLSIDYRDLDDAKRKLDEFEKAKAAYEAARKTTPQEEIERQAKEAADAAGGSPEMAKVLADRAAERGMNFASQGDIDWEEKYRKQIVPAARKAVREAPNEVARGAAELQLAVFESQLAKFQDRIREANASFFTKQVGDFLLGETKAIAMMKALVDERPEAFKEGAREKIRGMHGNRAQAEEAGWAKIAAETDAAAAEVEEEGRKKLEAQGAQGAADVKAGRDQQIREYASNFGQQQGLGGFLDFEAQKAVAGGATKPDAIRAAIAPEAKKRLLAGGVPEALADEVAATILNKVIDKVLAELVARSPDVQKAAKEGLAEDAAKAGVKQEAAHKRENKAGAAGAATHNAAQIERDFGGMVSHEQAQTGAEHLNQLMAHGVNPAVAFNKVSLQMTEFLRQNILAWEQMNGVSVQMEMLLQQANQKIGMLQAQISMTEGKVRVQRNQRAFPMNIIPGG